LGERTGAAWLALAGGADWPTLTVSAAGLDSRPAAITTDSVTNSAAQAPTNSRRDMRRRAFAADISMGRGFGTP